MVVDSGAAVQFLQTAYEPDDWIALFLKSYVTGRCTQRVGPVALFIEPRVHTWLRAINVSRFNIYVSVNVIKAGVRNRTKDAIDAIRHVFVEADENGAALIARIASRPDLPPPSFVIHSSPNRLHALWRAAGFDIPAIERLQKHLASELNTDPAATPCSQTTRLPGYVNHKYSPGHLVTVDYGATVSRHSPSAFPVPPAAPRRFPRTPIRRMNSGNAVERARRYLAKIEPAIAGQHGDLHTFKVCCRLVRGFELSDDDALLVLQDWNPRCEPPWTARELCDKVARARRYGKEPFGGLSCDA